MTQARGVSAGLRGLCGWLVVVMCGLVFVPSAFAGFGVSVVDGGAFEQDGSASLAAGGHPYELSTVFELNQAVDSTGNIVADGGLVKTIRFDLPPGLVGNPQAAPRCPMGVFLLGSSDNKTGFSCPASTQVGITRVKIAVNGVTIKFSGAPVYSIQPSLGAAATLAFNTAGLPIFVDAVVSAEGGYHVRAVARDTSEGVVVLGASLRLWGLPSDASHDFERACQGDSNVVGCSTDRTEVPFFTNPTACPRPGDGLVTELSVDSWSLPGVFARASFASHLPPGASLTSTSPPTTSVPKDRWGAVAGPQRCDRLPFAPSMDVTADPKAPDSPSGVQVDLSFPQAGLVTLDGVAAANLKDARVTFPKGVSVSPSSAHGLEGCTDDQIGFGTDSPVLCPDGSKIGTVVATTPVLDEALEGSVFVGSQQSNDPESGKMFRVFLVVENEVRGVLVKLRGKVLVHSDGQIETVFENNPQFPVSTISVRLKTGSRAPLATPLDCGKKTVRAELSSWGGQTASVEDSFTIDCPLSPPGFSPLFTAGAVNPTGGRFSPFGVRINRADGQQYLEGVTARIPSGLAARLRGVPLCKDSDATAGSCPLETRIGTATVGAGPGESPFYLRAPVYFTGPYQGAPYGLSVPVRAAAGPFDLGLVVVRQALFIDPVDAHLTVRSDPLPVIVKGVPVRLRSVVVVADRPGFTLNPTSCATKQIAADLTSTLPTTITQTVRFQAAGCASLPFSPKLALRLTGRGQTRDGDHPGLKAIFTQPPHQAGIRAATVKLPLSMALDPANAASDTLCEFEEGQKADPHCPASSIIGKARATSSLLNRPVAGNVYFVKNVRIDKKTGRRIRTLPTLLFALRGEVALNVRTTTTISHNRLTTTLPTVPDAPIGRFDLTLNGGKHGILVVTTDQNLCRGKQKATTTLTAQNNKRTTTNPTIKTPCKR